MRRVARSARVSFALFAGCLPAMLVVAADVQAESLAQIPLHYRMAEELLPILRPLLPPGSAITGAGNVLFVRADAATLTQVRDAVASLDRAPRQLLITVGQGMGAQDYIILVAPYCLAYYLYLCCKMIVPEEYHLFPDIPFLVYHQSHPPAL